MYLGGGGDDVVDVDVNSESGGGGKCSWIPKPGSTFPAGGTSNWWRVLARAGGDSCAYESGILRTAGTNTDGGTLGEAWRRGGFFEGGTFAEASGSKLIKGSNKDYNKRSGSGNESHRSYTVFCHWFLLKTSMKLLWSGNPINIAFKCGRLNMHFVKGTYDSFTGSELVMVSWWKLYFLLPLLLHILLINSCQTH